MNRNSPESEAGKTAAISEQGSAKQRQTPTNGARNTKDNSEEETLHLIGRVKAGDNRAFGELMNRYQSQVANIAYRMVNDYDDAKDVSQLVFVKTADNIDSYDPSKRFSTWLYRITVNASIDYIRKHRRHNHEHLDNYADSLENLEASPAQIYYRKHLRFAILKAADHLNAKQRAAFILKDMEGHEVSEVAEILNMPEATVRWYIHRARLRLRRELKGQHSLRTFGSEMVNSLIRN
ncbi:MAG: sigma-70 family RNA polymerase sigma factor [Candidatus Zixiibacteriota bacterium]